MDKREIIFRGKGSKFGEWVFGSYDKDGDLCYIRGYQHVATGDEHEKPFDYLVDPSTVGEYTGRNDKNGTRIFEGDVLSGLFSFGLEFNSICTFRNGSFGVKWMRGDAEMFQAFTSFCNVEWEVVGNIYDNPELEEGAKS